jgi:hypothetical protein
VEGVGDHSGGGRWRVGGSVSVSVSVLALDGDSVVSRIGSVGEGVVAALGKHLG